MLTVEKSGTYTKQFWYYLTCFIVEEIALDDKAAFLLPNVILFYLV